MMTRKTYLAVAGMLAGFFVAGLGVAIMLPDDRPGVTKSNFDQIKKGMSVECAEAVLGKTPFLEASSSRTNVRCFYSWGNDDGAIASICFDNDSVTDMTWTASNETLSEKFLRWLRPKKN